MWASRRSIRLDRLGTVRQLRFFRDNLRRIVHWDVVEGGYGDNEDRKRILRNLERKLDGRVALTIETVESIKLTPRGKAIYVDQRIDSEVTVTRPQAASKGVCGD